MARDQDLGRFRSSPDHNVNGARQCRRRHDDGFTLIEILVVLAVIALIMSLVGPRVVRYLSSSRQQAAKIQIESLSGSLELLYLDIGRYPADVEGLTALVERPKDGATWNGPYLRGDIVPQDPWGHPYLYVFPGKHGPFDISSFGPDGIEGSGDDVNGWRQ